MREHFDLLKEEEPDEQSEFYEDTDSPTKSPVKDDTKVEDIDITPTPVEQSVAEFNIGESPDLVRKTKDEHAIIEPPSAGIPDS
jgi:hypothetical protein